MKKQRINNLLGISIFTLINVFFSYAQAQPFSACMDLLASKEATNESPLNFYLNQAVQLQEEQNKSLKMYITDFKSLSGLEYSRFSGSVNLPGMQVFPLARKGGYKMMFADERPHILLASSLSAPIDLNQAMALSDVDMAISFHNETKNFQVVKAEARLFRQSQQIHVDTSNTKKPTVFPGDIFEETYIFRAQENDLEAVLVIRFRVKSRDQLVVSPGLPEPKFFRVAGSFSSADFAGSALRLSKVQANSKK